MKLFRLFTFLGALTLAASCSENEIDSTFNNGVGCEIKAQIPSSSDTRVAFDNQISDGEGAIVLSWQEGDEFVVSGGSLTDDVIFSYVGDNTFSSSSELVANEKYTATFGKAVTSATQSANNSLEHLDDMIVMEADFTYTSDIFITFKHTQCFLRIDYNVDFVPESFKYSDGTNNIDLTLENHEAGDNSAYIAIEPLSGERDIEIEVSGADVTESFSVTTSKEYSAGQLYVGVAELSVPAPELTIDVTEVVIPAEGGEVFVNVTYTGNSTWEYSKSWKLDAEIIEGENLGTSDYYPKFDGNAKLRFYVDSANGSSETKSLGDISFEVDDETVLTIAATQAGSAPYISVVEDTFDVECEGGKFSFDVNCLDGADWRSDTSNTPSWMYSNASWGYAPKENCMLTVEANTDTKPRSGSIIFYLDEDNSISCTLTVNQAGYVYKSPADIDILRACYQKSVDGLSYNNKWSKFTGWSSDKTSTWYTEPSDFYGVTGDGDYVKEISLKSNNMSQEMVLDSLKYMTKIDISDNDVESLSLKGCESLVEINCYNNEITSLNISGCENLEILNFGNQWRSTARNNVDEIDLSECVMLKELNLAYHDIVTLDLSKNSELTTLNVSGCEKLESIKFGTTSLPETFTCTGWGEQDAASYPSPYYVDGYQYPKLTFEMGSRF